MAETLFPYIKDHLNDFLTKHWNDDETQQDVEKLRQLAVEDQKNGTIGLVSILPKKKEFDEKYEAEIRASVVGNVVWQMSQDRKSTALKQLQGHMWRSGYENGELKGQ